MLQHRCRPLCCNFFYYYIIGSKEQSQGSSSTAHCIHRYHVVKCQHASFRKRCPIWQKLWYTQRTRAAFYIQVMCCAMTHRILEKRSRLPKLPNVVQHRYSGSETLARCHFVTKAWSSFFDQIFSRAMWVRDWVFSPLRYAQTGYTKYTVPARSLAYDLFIMHTWTHVPSSVNA